MAEPMAAPDRRAYWCFISYRHADNREPGRQWATWLHQAIETYEVPAELVGQVNARGDTIPARIFPVFRDEEELPVDADLAAPIYRALDASRFLLVICSPRSAASPYVGNEIRYFKQLGFGDRVLAVMIEGEPNASSDAGKQAMGFAAGDECFPEALRHAVGPDGAVLADRSEPIAADFRIGAAQGWTSPEAYRLALRDGGGLSAKTIDDQVEAYRRRCELMKLKIIAGILGVPLGTLTQRDKAYQLALAQKRAKTLRRWLVAVAALALIAAALGLTAYRSAELASAQRDIARNTLNRLMVSRVWENLGRGETQPAVRYALNGLQDAATPVALQELRSALAATLFASGNSLPPLVHEGPVNAAHFSADGLKLVTASDDGTARIWDASTGKPIVTLKGHAGPVIAARFSAEAILVATAGKDKTVKLWNADTGQLLETFSGHTDTINDVAFAPDDQRIVTASEDGTAKVWDVTSGRLIFTLRPGPSIVATAVFSPDGQRILTTELDNSITLWSSADGRRIAKLTGHSDLVIGASFSPDSQRIVTASLDRTAKIWNAADGTLRVTLTGHIGAVQSAQFSPDGRRVVTASEDKSAKIWDAATGEAITTLAGHNDIVARALFSADGRRIVTASLDRTAKLWDAIDGALLATLSGPHDRVSDAEFAPDGSRIVTANQDGTAKIWTVGPETVSMVLLGHTSWLMDACFSPDGQRIATASSDQSVKLWSARDGRLLSTIDGHGQSVYGVAFSTDGKRLALASAGKTASVVDPDSGRTLVTMSGHGGVVVSVAFSPG